MCVCVRCVCVQKLGPLARAASLQGPTSYLLSVLAQLMVRRHFANAHRNSNTQCIFRRTRASSALRRAILHLKNGGCVEHDTPATFRVLVAALGPAALAARSNINAQTFVGAQAPRREMAAQAAARRDADAVAHRDQRTAHDAAQAAAHPHEAVHAARALRILSLPSCSSISPFFIQFARAQ